MATFNLIKEALKASLGKEVDRIPEYVNKLDHIIEVFHGEVNSSENEVEIAEILFNWLWKKKLVRYKSGGHYRLTDVINAQIDKDKQEVGNCLGLTLLYNCLLKKMGTKANMMFLEHAFDRGPHVLTVLQTNQFFIDIEHVFPDGFDYKEHKKNSVRKIWGDKELVADIYNTRANTLFESEKFDEAMKHYDRAIQLNPDHEYYQLNKINLQDRMNMEQR